MKSHERNMNKNAGRNEHAEREGRNTIQQQMHVDKKTPLKNSENKATVKRFLLGKENNNDMGALVDIIVWRDKTKTNTSAICTR